MTSMVINKKVFKIKDIRWEIKKIPKYLTRENKSFQLIIDQTLSILNIKASNYHRKQLQQIAILLYKSKVIPLCHRLGTTYLKSGMGQLLTDSKTSFNYSNNLKIWPKEIKSMLRLTTRNSTDENNICSKFVTRHLYKFDYQLKQYQIKYNKKVNKLTRSTLKIEHIFETYLEQNLSTFRLEIEDKIELVHYDYHIQALKLVYDCHYPNDYQNKLFQQLCQNKYELEIREQEFNFLKQQITYYKSPSQSTSFNSIHTTNNIKQALFNQHKKITLKKQQYEYRKKYDMNIKKILYDHRVLINNEEISMLMFDLIDERCKQIVARIQCIYKFKIQC
ncbi:unnamed protein product [Rotaria magnacalcarata]|nr:unnamed protein product [Rotaria magnacalcarata]CAF2046921.1 unnamed protein product [Rotaria magnacalcarata]